MVIPDTGVTFGPQEGSNPSLRQIVIQNNGVVPFSLVEVSFISVEPWGEPGEESSQFYVAEELELPIVFPPAWGQAIKNESPAPLERVARLSLRTDYGTEPILVEVSVVAR